MKLLFIFFTLTLSLFSHSGKLDSHGGHTDKNTDIYHYHTTKKGTNINPFHAPIYIQILKYGFPYAIGQKFSSLKRCNAMKRILEHHNIGDIYSYTCSIN